MDKRGSYDKEYDISSLGGYLRSVRIKKKQTQEEIAIKIRRTKSSICRIERGNRQGKCLKGHILYELADAYGVPHGEVLRRADWPQLLLMDTSEEERQKIIRYLKDNL
ncbi:helix-turn-helix domain-containing protein [Chloroflexota bacterium]